MSAISFEEVILSFCQKHAEQDFETFSRSDQVSNVQARIKSRRSFDQELLSGRFSLETKFETVERASLNFKSLDKFLQDRKIFRSELEIAVTMLECMVQILESR